jgi:hypothetical protein
MINHREHREHEEKTFKNLCGLSVLRGEKPSNQFHVAIEESL